MRLLSRLTLGDAGTTISTSAATHDGTFDGVCALSAGTLGLTISGVTHTGLILAAGSTVTGDISQVTHTAGGPIAIYVRKD
jgi:hypothetical protein